MKPFNRCKYIIYLVSNKHPKPVAAAVRVVGAARRVVRRSMRSAKDKGARLGGVTDVRRKRQLVLVILTALLLASCQSDKRTSSSAINNQPDSGPTLIGRWRQVGPVADESTMVFTNDGKLIYSIHTAGKTQIINMVYEVSGDQIITDQPSNPRKEISKFYFEPSGILVVDYQGEKTRFMRER